MLLKCGNYQPEMLSFLHGQVGIMFGTALEILVHLIFLANAGLRVLLHSQVRIKQCRKHFLLLVSYGYYNHVKILMLDDLFLKTSPFQWLTNKFKGKVWLIREFSSFNYFASLRLLGSSLNTQISISSLSTVVALSFTFLFPSQISFRLT